MESIDTLPTCNVVACAHPLKYDQQHYTVAANKTIAEILFDDCDIKYHGWGKMLVYVGDRNVPKEYWGKVRPKAGQSIYVRAIPQGGGGDKGILSFVLAITVTLLAPGIGTALAGKLGISGAIGIGLVQAGVGLVGNLLVNALVGPPKIPNSFSRPTRESPTYSISQSRNEIRPFQSIPFLCGIHRISPPLGSLPYTEIEGDDQYLRQLFVLGYGPMQISDIKIGETPLSEFPEDSYELEIRQGFEDDEPITLITDSIFEESLSVALTNSGGPQVRTTQPDADRIVIDITLPGGLVFFEDDGDKSSRSLDFAIEYKDTASATWTGGDTYNPVAAQSVTIPSGIYTQGAYGAINDIAASGVIYIDKFTGQVGRAIYRIQTDPYGNTTNLGDSVPSTGIRLATFSRSGSGPAVVTDIRSAANIASFQNPTDFIVTNNADNNILDISPGGIRFLFRITGRSSELIRRSITIDTPAPSQYDVRITRLTGDSNDTRLFDDSTWSALRTVTDQPPISFKKPLAMIAIRIRATEQLNGAIDQLNCIASAFAPTYNTVTSMWDTLEISSNPAALYRYVLQGVANNKAVPDSMLDIAEFSDWYIECENQGYTFNQYIDFTGSVQQILQSIASAGRSLPASKDGLYSVIQDKPRTIPVQHFSERNTRGFRGSKQFSENPHALRIRFANQNEDFRQDERIVYDDGFDVTNATQFETLDLPGHTDPNHIFKMGRYYLAVGKLRPETYSFDTDFENLVATRGDLIVVQSGVAGWGVSSGRIKDLITVGTDITEFVMDENCQMVAGNTYHVRIRKSDGSSNTYDIVTDTNTNTVIKLNAPTPIAGGPEIGDLFLFGIQNAESERLLIKDISPSGDLTARLTCVNYNDGVYNSDVEAIPAFDSNVTEDPFTTSPQFDNFQSDEAVMARDADGSLRSRIFIKIKLTSASPLHKASNLEVQYKANEVDSTFIDLPIMTPDTTSFYINGVDDTVEYLIRARYRFNDGQNGPWTEATHRVIGKTSLPSDVDAFTVQRLADGTREFSWVHNFPPLDIGGYLIRFRSGTGHAWDDMEPLHNGILTSSPFESNQRPAGTYTFGIKSVDTSGNQSENELIVEATLGDPRIGNALLFEDVKQQVWPGAKLNCFVDPLTIAYSQLM